MVERDEKELRREYEELLDDRAADGGAVSEAYRSIDQLEPPRALDKAILAEARAAVKADKREARGWLTWLMPAGAVAGIALAAVLVIRVMPELGGPADQPIAATPGEESTSTEQSVRVVSSPVQRAADNIELLPEPRVWFAGIRQLRAEGDIARADLERDKFRSATFDSSNVEDIVLPDPDVWERGINLVAEEGETELAEQERRKLRELYPDYR